jgi:hypothetical protein
MRFVLHICYFGADSSEPERLEAASIDAPGVETAKALALHRFSELVPLRPQSLKEPQGLILCDDAEREIWRFRFGASRYRTRFAAYPQAQIFASLRRK